jgi:hypothetical protein
LGTPEENRPGLSTEASSAHCPMMERFQRADRYVIVPFLKPLTVMAITPMQAKSEQQ